MTNWTQTIKEKLDTYLRRGCKPFGSKEGHLNRKEPPLQEEILTDFESTYSVSLPRFYRDFLLNVTSGPIGPAYGLVPFSSIVDEYLTLSKEMLTTAFPHESNYNPDDDPKWVDIERRFDEEELPVEEYDRLFDSLSAGTIAVCHEGCGYFHRLVVTGPTRGQMWLDGMASDQGFVFLEVDFVTWYERWLDDALAGGSGTWWLR